MKYQFPFPSVNFCRMFALLVGLCSLIGAPTSASAITVTATELIRDILPLDAFHRDLERIRETSLSGPVVEGSDTIIENQNLVDNDFGLVNLDSVSYRHDLTWLNPPVSTYLFGSLTIQAFGVLGGNDVVFADSIELGALNNGLFSTTVFASSNPIDLAFLLVDGYLNIFIDKNDSKNCCFGLHCLNALSVYSSELTVRYESVPEPGTMLLLGSGLAALGLRRRSRRA